MPCAYSAGSRSRISTSPLTSPYPLACASRTARPVPSVVTDSVTYRSVFAMDACRYSSKCGSSASTSGVYLMNCTAMVLPSVSLRAPHATRLAGHEREIPRGQGSLRVRRAGTDPRGAGRWPVAVGGGRAVSFSSALGRIEQLVEGLGDLLVSVHVLDGGVGVGAVPTVGCHLVRGDEIHGLLRGVAEARPPVDFLEDKVQHLGNHCCEVVDVGIPVAVVGGAEQ